MQFRVDSGYFSNLKIRKLQRRLGEAGVVAHLRLFAYAAEHRPTGELAGMTSEDVETVTEWPGEAGVFVKELISLRLLDVSEGDQALTIHHWPEHNPWVSESPGRSENARLQNHLRHHVQKGIVQPKCRHCQPESVTEAVPPVTDSATSEHAPATVSLTEPSAELQAFAVEYNAIREEWNQRKVRESNLGKLEARFEACRRAMCSENPDFSFSELLCRVRRQSQWFRDKWPRWDLDWLLSSKRDVLNAAKVWSLEYAPVASMRTATRGEPSLQPLSDDSAALMRREQQLRQQGGAQ